MHKNRNFPSHVNATSGWKRDSSRSSTSFHSIIQIAQAREWFLNLKRARRKFFFFWPNRKNREKISVFVFISIELHAKIYNCVVSEVKPGNIVKKLISMRAWTNINDLWQTAGKNISCKNLCGKFYKFGSILKCFHMSFQLTHKYNHNRTFVGKKRRRKINRNKWKLESENLVIAKNWSKIFCGIFMNDIARNIFEKTKLHEIFFFNLESNRSWKICDVWRSTNNFVVVAI